MIKRYQYKIITSTNGFAELEQQVSKMLNQGWKPLGGLAFNQGHPYQALAKLVTTPIAEPSTENPTQKAAPKGKTFNEALKDLDY